MILKCKSNESKKFCANIKLKTKKKIASKDVKHLIKEQSVDKKK